MRIALLLAVLSAVISPPLALAQVDVFDAMKSKLRYLSARQSVISQNIANADTPQYKAKDLESVNFMEAQTQKSRSVGLTTTHPGHIGGQRSSMPYKTTSFTSAYETAPNGNNVVLEEQTVNMTQNNLEYQTTVNLMRKLNGLMKTAIGDNAQ